MEFERPTPKQRLDEVAEVAKIMGNPPPPTSILFENDGSATVLIGNPLLPVSNQLGNGSKGRGSEKPKKTQSPMKANQERHSQNLRGFSGRYKGRNYRNGQPTDNGKH